jgi:hypothetical protein
MPQSSGSSNPQAPLEAQKPHHKMINQQINSLLKDAVCLLVSVSVI